MEPTEIEGWRCEQSQFMNTAARSSRGQETEVTMEECHFEVRAEVGSGYMRETTNAYVPIAVIVRMMEHAGYTITPPTVQPSADQG